MKSLNIENLVCREFNNTNLKITVPALKQSKLLASKYKNSDKAVEGFFVENLIRKQLFGLSYSKYIQDSISNGIDISLNPNISRYSLDIKTKTLSSIIKSIKGTNLNEDFKWEVSVKNKYANNIVFTILDDTKGLDKTFKIYFLGYITKNELLKVPVKDSFRDIPINNIHIFDKSMNIVPLLITTCCLNDNKEIDFWKRLKYKYYGDIAFFEEGKCSLYLGEKYSYIIHNEAKGLTSKQAGFLRAHLYISKSENIFSIYRQTGNIYDLMKKKIFKEKFSVFYKNDVALENLICAIEYGDKKQADKQANHIKNLEFTIVY